MPALRCTSASSTPNEFHIIINIYKHLLGVGLLAIQWRNLNSHKHLDGVMTESENVAHEAICLFNGDETLV